VSLIVKQGDTTWVTFSLKKNSASFAITVSSTVEVRFYENDVLNDSIGTLVASSSEVGADWANSVITILVNSTITALLSINARLEPRVTIVDDAGERITYTGEELPILTVKPGFN